MEAIITTPLTAKNKQAVKDFKALVDTVFTKFESCNTVEEMVEIRKSYEQQFADIEENLPNID